MGSGYIIDHCVTALRLSREKEQEQEMIINYLADGLYAISTTLGRVYGGTTLKYRLTELRNPEPEETRTGEEIINSIKDKLKAVEDNE